MNIESITGDYVVLSSKEEFQALQAQFNNIEDYTEKLQFWYELPYYKEKLERGDIPHLAMTYEEALKQPGGIQGIDVISLVPSKAQEKTLIDWLINLPDNTLVQMKEEYDSFDNKNAFLNVRLEYFISHLEQDAFFYKTCSICYKGNVAILIDEYRAMPLHDKMPLYRFVNIIREAQSWLSFFKHIGYDNVPDLLLERRMDGQVHTMKWLGNNIDLIVFVKLLYECKYIEAKSLKEAFERFGAFFNIHLEQPHSALNKFLENNKDGYEGFLDSFNAKYDELRAGKHHTKPKKSPPSKK